MELIKVLVDSEIKYWVIRALFAVESSLIELMTETD